MPRTYARQPGNRRYADYTSEKLQECLEAIRNRTMSTRQAEKHFNIPRRTLMYKLKQSHEVKPGQQPIFTKEEETIFAQCVFDMSDFGFPVDEFELRCIIHVYLGRIGRKVNIFKNNFPGKDWTRVFLKRNSEVTVRFAANIKKARAAINEATLKEYIENLKETLEGVAPENIWNYDESNLTDDPGSKKVLTKRGVKYPENVRNSSKASISIMMSGSATGELLPPYIVYKSQNMWSTWSEGGPAGCRYNNSKSGWFTSEIFTDWFQVLMLPRLKKIEGKKLVIGDNLSSHITDIVLKKCRENDIYFVCLPPNSTHLTQPLDVAFFRPMKAAWKTILGSYKESEAGLQSSVLQKQHFPRLLKNLMDVVSINAANNLNSGFRKCGIVPCEVCVLLEWLPGQACERDSIENSFKEFLNNKRCDIVGNSKTKRRRINVKAGKSIAHEIMFTDNEAGPANHNNGDTNQEMGNAANSSNNTGNSNEEEVKRKLKNKKNRVPTSSSESGSEIEDLSLQDSSSGPEDFDDLLPEKEEERNQNKEGWQPVQKKKGEFVVFTYEGELFPGKIESFNTSTVVISAMQRSFKSLKWPVLPDTLQYSWMDVLGGICPPKPINKRVCFSVPELDKIWF